MKRNVKRNAKEIQMNITKNRKIIANNRRDGKLFLGRKVKSMSCKYRWWKKSIALGFAVVLGLTGCSGISGGLKLNPEKIEKQQERAAEEMKTEFCALSEELFRSEIVESTLNLHYTLAYPERYGIESYEVTLGDYSLASYELAYAELKELAHKLEKIDGSLLAGEDALVYRMLQEYVETELTAENLQLYNEFLGPTLGVQAQLPVLLAEYTFRTKRDIEDYLGLLAEVDEVYGQIMEWEKAKAEAGLFMADYAAEDVISQCKQFVEKPEENFLITTFDERIEAFQGISDTEKAEYKKRNAAIVLADVVNGYQLVMEEMENLQGSGKNDAGLFYYEDGIRYYEYLVKTQTGSGDSVKQLQKRTARFISDSLQEMADLITAHPELIHQVAEYSFGDGTPEEMLAELQQKLEMDYPQPADTTCTVKYVDESMQEHLSPAFYLTPPIDEAQENVIYINPRYVDGELYTTLAHEGYPGHLYQTTYTNQETTSLVRNLLSYKGYTEGWATYVEFDAYLMSDLEESLAKLLQLNDKISLAISAYVDMGVNYEGWKQEAVLQYLEEFGIGGEETAQAVFRTVVEEPGNYLSYFIGYLEIEKLKEKAQNTLGDAFVVKEFHEFMLKTGAASFEVLEEELENWLQYALTNPEKTAKIQ